MEKKVVPGKAVAAVIKKDDKVLILQRSSDEAWGPDLWELPSGKKELLEGINESLVREVKEETGLDVEIEKILSAFDYQIEKDSEIRDVTQINYLVNSVADNEIKLSKAHQKFAWIGKDEIENYNITKETKQVIINSLSVI
jgi:8-oxo-dGTP diphosphatase